MMPMAPPTCTPKSSPKLAEYQCCSSGIRSVKGEELILLIIDTLLRYVEYDSGDWHVERLLLSLLEIVRVACSGWSDPTVTSK